MNSPILKLFFCFTFLFITFSVSQKAGAQDGYGPIFINELMWQGSNISAADEWIELYNDSEVLVDISGWVIFNDVKQEIMVEISQGKIAPKSFFLIGNNGKSHMFKDGESVLNIDPDVVASSISLSNTELKISLRNKEGITVDIAGDGGLPFFAKSNSFASLERINYADGTLVENWREATSSNNLDEGSVEIANPNNSGSPKISEASLSSSVFLVGTKNNYNINYKIIESRFLPQKIFIEVFDKGLLVDKIEVIQESDSFDLDYNFCPEISLYVEDKTGLSDKYDFQLECAFTSSDIYFSEVLPHPKSIDWNKDGICNSGDEWIELYSDSSQDINLNGWIIRDKSGKEFSLSGYSIKAKSFLVLYKSNTKLALNDDSELLLLVDPRGEVISEVDVPSSVKKIDKSFSFLGNNWNWTKRATPLSRNIFEALDDDVGIKKEAEDNSRRIVEETNLLPANNLLPEAEVSDESENFLIKKTINTTVRKIVPAKLSSMEFEPIVLGASVVIDNSSNKAFIRIEHLLYFFGFTVFLLISLFYDFYHQ